MILYTTVKLLYSAIAPLICSGYQTPKKINNTKYILLWTSRYLAPLTNLVQEFDAFVTNKCEYTNCYVTYNESYLGGVQYFDAVVINGRDLPNPKNYNKWWKARNVNKTNAKGWPKHRLPRQKYVYANLESPQNVPVRKSDNGVFNWTWTYKFNSDLRWGYFSVYDLKGQVVGPKTDMHWLEMKPVDESTKVRLSSKTSAAAWFVSKCVTLSKRGGLAKRIAKELRQYDLDLDIYGKCGNFVCPRMQEDRCNRILERNYYFYLAFENSFDEDYITEKVVRALNHYTVPIVFGGANYSRFLPPGSYLDALQWSPEALAALMASIIYNHRNGDGSLYHNFFRWRQHYTFKLTSETGEVVCKICKLLNDPEAMSRSTVYDNLVEWWNGSPKRIRAYVKSRNNLQILGEA